MTQNWSAPHSRLRATVLLVIVTAACSPTRGCIESNFELARESRVPSWFDIPPGVSRANLTVELTYWLGPVGRTATVTLRDRGGRKVKSVVATMQGDEPHALVPVAPTGPFPYPSYEILSAEGVTEVVEHRRMEPIFYVVDDAEVKNKLGIR